MSLYIYTRIFQLTLPSTCKLTFSLKKRRLSTHSSHLLKNLSGFSNQSLSACNHKAELNLMFSIAATGIAVVSVIIIIPLALVSLVITYCTLVLKTFQIYTINTQAPEMHSIVWLVKTCLMQMYRTIWSPGSLPMSVESSAVANITLWSSVEGIM